MVGIQAPEAWVWRQDAMKTAVMWNGFSGCLNITKGSLKCCFQAAFDGFIGLLRQMRCWLGRTVRQTIARGFCRRCRRL